MPGTAYCVFAALGYTVVNICLRDLAVKYDPAWILCMKETMAVVLMGPWLAGRAIRGQSPLPGGRPLVTLVVVGLLTHLAGNLPLIWSMGIVGLAITMPVALGVNLVACAVLGRLYLGEKVSPQSTLALGILIVSVVLLGGGAGKANQGMARLADVATGPLWVSLAVAASCLAGVIFGLLNVTIRRSATEGVSLAAIAFLVPAMGAASLTPLCLGRHGLWGLLETAPRDLLLMVGCGTLNLLSYVALIKGLQTTTVVHANVLGASQVAMAAVAGFLFFEEAASPALVLGVLLTIAGMVMADRSG